MKYGFINKAIHSLISCFNTTPTANSSRELAFVVCENQSPKKANIGKTAAVAALLALGGVAHGQNSATLDPKYYSIENPYEIPNLPNGSVIDIMIKTGAPIPTIIDGADAGSLRIGTPDGRNILNTSNIILNKPGIWAITYTENGAERAIGGRVTYQSDIFGPEGDRPDVVMVEPGQTAKLSGGPNMALYGRNDGTGWTGGSRADSTKTVGYGTHELRTGDGSGTGINGGNSQDTIAVIERPVANNNTRTLAFATTVPGVIYKVYKASTASTDTTWTEEPSLSFVGDGNPANVNTGLGIFRIGAMRRAGDDVLEAKDDKTFKVDFGTEVYEMREKPEPTFVINGRTLYFKEDVKYQIIDMSGHIIKTGKGNMESVPQAGIYILLLDNQKHKIHISP